MDYEILQRYRQTLGARATEQEIAHLQRQGQSRQTADYLLSTDPYRAWQEAADQLLQRAVASRERALLLLSQPAPPGIGWGDWTTQTMHTYLTALAEERGVRAAIELIPGYGTPAAPGP